MMGGAGGETSAVLVPVTEEIPVPAADPYTLFRALGIEKGFILESMEGMPRRAVRSIIGLEPEFIITMDDECRGEGRNDLAAHFSSPRGDDAISRFRDISGRLRPVTDRTGFIGGFVGYCAYELVTGLSGGRVQAGRMGTPLARFMLANRGIVYDHVKPSCLLFDDLVLVPGSDPTEEREKALQRISALKARISAISPETGKRKGNGEETVTGPVSSSMSREEYERAVVRAKSHIRAGDIFQVVLSRRVSCPFRGDPLEIYGAIRNINPSPYLYYLHFGDEVIIGSSPEMLVKVEGKEVQTVPIAGTRPRGMTPEEDDRLARELLADEKERAEHLMLVDLARNDIGRVAEFGSVTVPEFMTIERFSHVQHIVSRVAGTLREGCDRFDALASCFPAGTVSGAPKVRAMQIISELEAHPRGLYAGAVGYAGFNDLMEFAIAIRTVRVSGGLAEYSTGAGIVADSVPSKEFEETEHKAGAMMSAVFGAGGGI